MMHADQRVPRACPPAGGRPDFDCVDVSLENESLETQCAAVHAVMMNTLNVHEQSLERNVCVRMFVQSSKASLCTPLERLCTLGDLVPLHARRGHCRQAGLCCLCCERQWGL
uniref:Cadmium resistance protein 2 n=1 Tax=Dunaliella viridis TaxID=140095 RepID=A0A0U2UGZ1_9CHLO|nr:cadmium resistance protein 2 [Dunaliella viridis]